MKRYLILAKNLAFTRTAKDTYIIFSGNILSAFLGFVYTLIAARTLSVPEFGIFSAAVNLVYIIISLSDFGVSSGTVQFVARLRSEGRHKEAERYIKSAFMIRIASTLFVSILLILFPLFIAERFLATNQTSVTYWVFISTLGFAFYTFFPYVLQADKKFLKSVVVENSFGVIRLGLTLIFLVLGILNFSTIFLSFSLGNLGPILLGFIFVGSGFLLVKPDIKIYKSLLLFSGWLGVNRVVSSISGRLDVQMLASLAGAIETGMYSIPSRLTLFVVIMTSSFSAVLAPRLSSFNNKNKEKAYIVKASLALIPIIRGILFWIVIAKPFIVLLFGEKYSTSTPILQVLAVSTIPFLMTAPAVTAIVYSMKKTAYIGIFALPQLVIIYILNRIFIPIYGAFGPAYTLIIVYSIFAVYVWGIVIRHYWLVKDKI